MYRRPAPELEVAKLRRQAVVQPLLSAIAGLLLGLKVVVPPSKL
jgi:hypothetical protein